MLCKKLYDRFVEDTGLDNDIYKAIFLKLDLCFETLLYKPSRFEIVMPPHYSKSITLDTTSSINSDVFDLIYNLFAEDIMYPSNSKIQAFFDSTLSSTQSLELITYANGAVTCTEQLQLMKQSKMYTLMFPRFNITNLLQDFNVYFSVFDTYLSTKPRILPLPIKVLFDSKTVKSDQSFLHKSNPSIDVKVAQKTSLVSGLKDQVNSLLEQALSIEKERKICLNKKSEIESLPEKWKSLVNEKDLLSIQLQSLLESEKYYTDSLEKFNAVLKDIDAIFTSYQNPNVKEMYKDKHDELEKLKIKKLDIQESINKIKQVLDNINSQKSALLQDAKRVDSMLSQLEQIDATELQELNKQYQELSEELSSIQNRIVTLQNQLQIEESSLAELQKKSSEFFYPAYVENKKEEIYSVLSLNTKTQPIVVIENYIKFLLAYESEKYAQSFTSLNNPTSVNLSCIYAFLNEYFTIRIPFIFSPFDLQLPEDSKCIKITE